MDTNSNLKAASQKPHASFMERFKDQKSLALAGIILVAIIIVLLIAFSGKPGRHRSESYKDVSGSAAGLNATIDYTCRTECKEKFDFNVYILGENGHQVSVARPDKNGTVRLALPEGDYVMLVGKQLGKDKLFPQENISLKNGKELELKVRYKEAAL